MQKLYRLLRSCKLPRMMLRSIGPTKEIFGNSGLPITMVPCLHQSNVYIKRKLQVCRAQKCNFLVGAQSYVPVRACKLPRVMLHHIELIMEIFRNSGLPIALVPCLHQSNVSIKKENTRMESPKMYSSRRCKNRTYLCGTANYLVSCKAV